MAKTDTITGRRKEGQLPDVIKRKTEVMKGRTIAKV